MNGKKKIACQVYLEPELHKKVLAYQEISKRSSLSNTIEFLIYSALMRLKHFNDDYNFEKYNIE